MGFELKSRRAVYVDITEEMKKADSPVSSDQIQHLETFDLIYRSLCALLYNYAPLSGHPGGSISSGRFVTHILFNTMDYDFSDPDRDDADIISYAAGHKALGLYALWALRNEIVRIGAPNLLPKEECYQLRLEDLLGFRRNPVTQTPLFKKFHAKPLDGHPTPATPFIRISTGASGVGVSTSLGLALGAMDFYANDPPRVHVVEGEGGMTPGRVSEAFAAAGTASLKNAIFHIDWNQSSIDSNRVCREDGTPGDYVQWDPIEFAYLHDWNAIYVPDGRDWQQIAAAQRRALAMSNYQPTAIVYRTIKGWKYGMEGKVSHGAGHKLCADGFFEALKPFFELTGQKLPRCETANQRCGGGKETAVMEECFWESLTVIRAALEKNRPMVDALCGKIVDARNRLNDRHRKPRDNAPSVEAIFDVAAKTKGTIPQELVLTPGKTTTLRAEMGRVLQYYNKASHGAILVAAADLLGSTSVNLAGQGFPEGYYNAATNPGARLMSIGGICEDAISGVLSGLSSYGHHIGVGSSYGAFIAPLGHITMRLHAIGNQARQQLGERPYRTMIVVCAHAGLKTGEDGPTHADPQALQLLQENFPKGTMITLTPWDPQEIWPLVSAALSKRPAMIAPFVTRPNEKVVDRKALGLPPVTHAVAGIYLLRRAQKKSAGVVVIQGSEVGYAFVEEALPLIEKAKLDLNVYYVTSAELFDLLPKSQQEKIFPEEHANKAMGITGFTLSTMYRWVRSDRGRKMSLHPFQHGHYLGSGQGFMVLREAGLDGKSQFKAIMKYLKG